MCKEAVRREPWSLEYVPDQYKTQEMCGKPVEKDLCLLEYALDWFVTHQKIKIWHDNDYHSNDDRLIEWYKGYQKRKAQKAKIKEELLPVTWNPSRHWNWCMSGDEKKEK